MSYEPIPQSLITNFRAVAKSYAALFTAKRDHIRTLLNDRHQYAHGVFREGLLREFLSAMLPSDVAVNSGFIYGFDQGPNSRQIDVLVWNHARHAAVYRTQEFVIVPPESVIAAISVKSRLEARDICDALNNLLSIPPLEFLYRPKDDKETFHPILKIVFSYESPTNQQNALATICRHYSKTLHRHPDIVKKLRTAVAMHDPFSWTSASWHLAEQILPQLIAGIGGQPFSCLQGWGLPMNSQTHIPYYYPQNTHLTSPLEKVMFHILEATYLTLGTPGHSLVSAWGDYNPVNGIRIGDASEILHKDGIAAFDPTLIQSS